MANENKGLLWDPADWSTTDKTAVLRDGEQGNYYNADDGTFYLIGDGVNTLQDLYDDIGVNGGLLDSTNFDARITALIGTSTNGLIDKKNGYRGSLATNPTADWASASAPYLPGAVVGNNDLYYFMFNSTSSSTEPALETEWEVCPDIQTASHLTKSIITSGMGSLSDPESSDFKNYYKIGEYSEGSNEFDLYRINVAGQTTSTSSTDFYKLVDNSNIKGKFSTFDTDHYELEDYRGCVISSGDASGGDRESNGTTQEDQVQGFTYYGLLSNQTGWPWSEDNDPISTRGIGAGATSVGSFTYKVYISDPISDGTNGTPRIGTETRMKNVANGCGCVHVMIARDTITSISG